MKSDYNKSSHNLLQFQNCLKSKASSETQVNILIVPPLKSKSKLLSSKTQCYRIFIFIDTCHCTYNTYHLLCTYHWYIHNKMVMEGIVRRFWINIKFCSSMSDVKGCRWFWLPSFATYNIQFSFWLILFPLCFCLWQTFHGIDISILGSPEQFRLHFQFLRMASQALHYHMLDFWNSWGRFQNSSI